MPSRVSMTGKSLYFDDLEVGMQFTSGSLRVEAGDIKRFAAEFDPQHFHLDERAAAKSMFGGLVASGWHTAAVSMRLLVDSLPLAGGLAGAAVQVEWLQPVRPGDDLCVEVEIEELRASRSRPHRGSAVLRCATLNQVQEVVQMLTARIIVPRKHGPCT